MKEFKSVTQTEKDMAGKRRVWVDIGEGETVMLKFEKDVSQKEIKDEIVKALKNRETQKENEMEQINRQIDDLQIRKKELLK